MKYKVVLGKQLYQTVCSWCQAEYYAERETSRTCSNKCRQAAYRGRMLLVKWREAGTRARKKETARK